jgi:hypothetical protein
MHSLVIEMKHMARWTENYYPIMHSCYMLRVKDSYRQNLMRLSYHSRLCFVLYTLCSAFFQSVIVVSTPLFFWQVSVSTWYGLYWVISKFCQCYILLLSIQLHSHHVMTKGNVLFSQIKWLRKLAEVAMVVSCISDMPSSDLDYSEVLRGFPLTL